MLLLRLKGCCAGIQTRLQLLFPGSNIISALQQQLHIPKSFNILLGHTDCGTWQKRRPR
jgi:hypothetical protein